jgi:hypothetical protein
MATTLGGSLVEASMRYLVENILGTIAGPKGAYIPIININIIIPDMNNLIFLYDP